jgi:hypothetical protein
MLVRLHLDRPTWRANDVVGMMTERPAAAVQGTITIKMDHSGKLFRTQAYRLSRTGIHSDQEAAARDLVETKADDEDQLPWQVRAVTIQRAGLWVLDW